MLKNTLNFFIYLLIVIIYLYYKSHHKKIELVNKVKNEEVKKTLNAVKKTARVADSYNITNTILSDTIDTLF